MFLGLPIILFLPIKASNTKTQIRTQIDLPNGVTIELGDDLQKSEISNLIESLCGVFHAAS